MKTSISSVENYKYTEGNVLRKCCAFAGTEMVENWNSQSLQMRIFLKTISTLHWFNSF